MTKAKLIFITGPSGTGKSTVAQAVANNWPSTCALIDFENMRGLIKSGYAEPADGWNDETERQWDIAKQAIAAMSEVYIRNGVSVVLPVFATPHDWPTWKKLLDKIDYKAFALMPEVEIVLARNNQSDGIAKLKESDIRQNYEWSVDWKNETDVTVLDNGSLNIAAIAKNIIEQSQ